MPSRVGSGESESRKFSALGFRTDVLLCLFRALAAAAASSRRFIEEFLTVEPLPLELPDSLFIFENAIGFEAVDGADT